MIWLLLSTKTSRLSAGPLVVLSVTRQAACIVVRCETVLCIAAYHLNILAEQSWANHGYLRAWSSSERLTMRV